jgi:hypothetical protein
MGLFSGYTLIILHAFSYIPCSCGGIIKRLTWRQHLVLNLFFVGLAIAGIILQRKKTKPPIITKAAGTLTYCGLPGFCCIPVRLSTSDGIGIV